MVDTCHPGLMPHQVIDRLCDAAGIREDIGLPDDTTIIYLDRRIGSASQAYRECPNSRYPLPLFITRNPADSPSAAKAPV